MSVWSIISLASPLGGAWTRIEVLINSLAFLLSLSDWDVASGEVYMGPDHIMTILRLFSYKETSLPSYLAWIWDDPIWIFSLEPTGFQFLFPSLFSQGAICVQIFHGRGLQVWSDKPQ